MKRKLSGVSFFKNTHKNFKSNLVLVLVLVVKTKALSYAWVGNYILATCRACSTKILLDSCTVFLEYTKIKHAKERLCWQDGRLREL